MLENESLEKQPSKTSLFVRTTPEEHDLAEALLKDRGDVSLSRMVVALITEDWARRSPGRDEPLNFVEDGTKYKGIPVRLSGPSVIVQLVTGDDSIRMRAVSAHQADPDDFHRARQKLNGS